MEKLETEKEVKKFLKAPNGKLNGSSVSYNLYDPRVCSDRPGRDILSAACGPYIRVSQWAGRDDRRRVGAAASPPTRFIGRRDSWNGTVRYRYDTSRQYISPERGPSVLDLRYP